MLRGQALVVVLLALAIAMTAGLAIVSRNVTEVGISTTQEESARALSAAESGVEAALGGLVANGTDISIGSQGTKYDVKTTASGGGRYVSFPEPLTSGETHTLFLADFKPDGSITSLPPSNSFSGQLDVCWGDTSESGETPALEAELYYYTASYQVARLAYDPAGRDNAFDKASVSAPGENCPSDRPYKYMVSWNPLEGASAFNIGAGKSVLMRLRMLYNPTQAYYLGVGTPVGSILPVQGVMIESTGKAGETARKVQVFRQYPDLPDLFDYAVYSGQDLKK